MTLPILYFTYSFATRSSASVCVNGIPVLIIVYNIILSVYHGLIIMLIILIQNVFALLLCQRSKGSSEDTNAHAQLNPRG